MTDAGLRVRSDGMGNIFGRWEGTHPAERAFHAGRSHTACPYDPDGWLHCRKPKTSVWNLGTTPSNAKK